jgi:hypothetical protein
MSLKVCDEYRAVSVGLKGVTICWSSPSYRRVELFTVRATPPCFLGRGEPTATACDKDGDVDENAVCCWRSLVADSPKLALQLLSSSAFSEKKYGGKRTAVEMSESLVCVHPTS